MKYHPMLFKPAMVKAILEGRKTQTRRIIKPQPSGENWSWGFKTHPDAYKETILSKWTPKDILWVKEPWMQCGYDRKNKKAQIKYLADGEYSNNYYFIPQERYTCDSKWQNSLFMPRWASRIYLVIKGIEAQKIQDIPNGDIRKEGLINTKYDSFIKLWNSIAANEYKWEKNPWVWVIDFEIK